MKIKKIINLLLVTAVTMSMLVLPAFADTQGGNSDFVIENGVLTAYIGPGGAVTIPSSVTSIGDDAFCNSLSPIKVTNITIPNSVTSIGTSAFCFCDSLTNVTIPSSVTSIGSDAFRDTPWLDKQTDDFVVVGNGVLIKYNGSGGDVVIPDGVTSIGGGAFYNCKSLTSVTIPNSMTSIGDEAFINCDYLNSVTIPSSVTSIGVDAFEGTTWFYNQTDDFVVVGNGVLIKYNGSGGDVVIPDGVISISGSSFDWSPYSTPVTSVTIPNSVTNIGDYALADDSLTSVTIPSSVTSIGDCAFADTSLTSVTIPNSVTSIGGDVFETCSNLTSVTIPSSVTNIGHEAFYECSSLTSITIPSGVTSIGDSAFSDCTSLISVTIPSSVTSVGENAFNETPWLEKYVGDFVIVGNNILIDYKGSASSVTIPSNVTSIGACAFDSCWNLTSVTIPSSVTSIGDSAFNSCSNLTSVTIPSSVTSICDNAFLYSEECIIHGVQDSYSQKFASDNKVPFAMIGFSFGTARYSTTALTNGNVIVTISVTDGTVSSLSHTFTANGSYTFIATDNDGNKVTKTVYINNIDKTKPTIKVSIGNGHHTTGKVTVTASDTNLKSKSITLNGKAISWSSNNTFAATGNYVVTATDKAGNTSTASFSIK